MSVSVKYSNTSNVFSSATLSCTRKLHAPGTKNKKSTVSTDETNSGTQLMIAETIDRSMKYQVSITPNQAVSVIIAKGMHPILTVEEPHFVSMLNLNISVSPGNSFHSSFV